MVLRLIGFLSFITIFLSCGSSKVLSPDESEGKVLILEHGGGFTGAMKQFYILENGQVFKNQTPNSSPYEVNTLDQNDATQIFKTYEVLGLSDLEMKSFGNLNYTITLKEKDKMHTLQWSSNQEGTDRLRLFYKNIMNIIKRNNERKGGEPAIR